MKITRSIAIALATSAVGAAAVVVITYTAHDPPPVPEACPPRWGGAGIGDWVPAAAELDGVADSLVPGSPTEALICAYPGTNTDPGGERLAGSRTLTREAEAMARDLAWLPVTAEARRGPCSLMGGPMTDYLIRFTYPDGRALWVGGAEEVNSCAAITNGTVHSPSYVGKSLTTAYKEGVWRIPKPDDRCLGPAERRGQNERMVPGNPTSVIVCGRSRPGRPTLRRTYGRQVALGLATALNDLDTVPSTNTCHGGGDEYHRLLFGYREGPSAQVRLTPGCVPSVDNGLLQADLDDPLHDQVARLAPPG